MMVGTLDPLRCLLPFPETSFPVPPVIPFLSHTHKHTLHNLCTPNPNPNPNPTLTPHTLTPPQPHPPTNLDEVHHGRRLHLADVRQGAALDEAFSSLDQGLIRGRVLLNEVRGQEGGAGGRGGAVGRVCGARCVSKRPRGGGTYLLR